MSAGRGAALRIGDNHRKNDGITKNQDSDWGSPMLCDEGGHNESTTDYQREDAG
jgi:hypothetical protein